MTTEAQQIANTILSQIGTHNLMCMGVPRRSVMALPEGEKRRGGVSFKFTNCFNIRNGRVEIDLLWIDTYTVRVYNQLGNLKSEADDIYCDGLAKHLMRVIRY